MAGLYIHVPFCLRKCLYCDFYSLAVPCAGYADAVARELSKYTLPALESVYFGGGTPTLLEPDDIALILNAACERFGICSDAEITVECNPATADEEKLTALRRAGVNRLSIGVQRSDDGELSALGRLHTFSDAEKTFRGARAAGFRNISCDIMLSIGGDSPERALRTVDAVCALGPEHISAYMLKIEPGTAYGKKPPELLPDDDLSADIYQAACARLSQHGYERYEISNFSLPTFESRHNLCYWDCGEYLGIGPAAHSSLRGKRFYYPPDLDAFMNAPHTLSEGEVDFRDYVMLRLRLRDGLDTDELFRRFGARLDEGAVSFLIENGLARGKRILTLTERGLLVQNSVLALLI